MRGSVDGVLSVSQPRPRRRTLLGFSVWTATLRAPCSRRGHAQRRRLRWSPCTRSGSHHVLDRDRSFLVHTISRHRDRSPRPRPTSASQSIDLERNLRASACAGIDPLSHFKGETSLPSLAPQRGFDILALGQGQSCGVGARERRRRTSMANRCLRQSAQGGSRRSEGSCAATSVECGALCAELRRFGGEVASPSRDEVVCEESEDRRREGSDRPSSRTPKPGARISKRPRSAILSRGVSVLVMPPAADHHRVATNWIGVASGRGRGQREGTTGGPAWLAAEGRGRHRRWVYPLRPCPFDGLLGQSLGRGPQVTATGHCLTLYANGRAERYRAASGRRRARRRPRLRRLGCAAPTSRRSSRTRSAKFPGQARRRSARGATARQGRPAFVAWASASQSMTNLIRARAGRGAT